MNRGEAVNRRGVRNTRKVQLSRVFLMGMAFSVPTIVLFWERHGLSFVEIALLQALFALATLLLEVPMGMRADVVGRRRTIIEGAFALVAGAVCYALSSSFVGFLAAEILLGLGFALVSGADQALLHDSLRDNERFREAWARGTAYEFIAAGTFSLIGSWMWVYGERLALWAGVLSFTVLVAIALSLEEPERAEILEDLLEVRKASWGCLREEHGLWRIIMHSAGLFMFFQSAFWAYQPYLARVGVLPEWNGVVYAAFGPTAALAAWALGRWRTLVHHRAAYAAAFAALSVSFALLAATSAAWGAVFLLIHQVVRGYHRVAASCLVQQAAREEVRATLASVQAMVARLAYAVALLPFGAFVQWGGVESAFTASAVGCALMAGMVLLRRYR